MSCSSGVIKDQPTLVGVLGRLLPKCLLKLDISTNSYNWVKYYFCLFVCKPCVAEEALGVSESKRVLGVNPHPHPPKKEKGKTLEKQS